MRHRYDCALRWADLDLLGHVNNVTYVDYLQEARSAMLRDCHRAAGVEPREDAGYVVVRHEVSYVEALLFGRQPVAIDSWVSELRKSSFTLDHEIYAEDDDGHRTVFVRARTILAPFVPSSGAPRRMTPEESAAVGPYLEESGSRMQRSKTYVDRAHAAHYPVSVRFSDIDVYRHVNNVVYFEYLQEARVRFLIDAGSDFSGDRVHQLVVAQTNVDYLCPIRMRTEPYDCWTQVRRVGRTSLTLDSEICDGEDVLARGQVVVVFLDAANRPAEPAADLKQRLLDLQILPQQQESSVD